MSQTYDAPEFGPIEWPTLALALIIYGGWLTLTWWHAHVPAWLLMPLGAWLVCWHSSLQHEVLHGHPTRVRWINTAIAFPPLALWLPYASYRQTHLIHHDNERLTDPLDDPESRYVTPEQWSALSPVARWLLRVQATLAGRLLVGPFWAIATFLMAEARAIAAGDRALLRTWIVHGIGVLAVAAWIVGICGMSLGTYIWAFALPGTALMLIRSFCEHRAEGVVERRTAIVDGRGPLSLLFLNNSLHAAHHERPHIAWYELPRYWQQHRDRLLAANGGLYYRGYGEVFVRYLIRPHDAVAHPLGRIPPRQP